MIANETLATGSSSISSRPEVVLSSTCFDERRLSSLCDYLASHGIHHLELSGNLLPIPEDTLQTLLVDRGGEMRFFVHNYFPVPDKPFVLNLAHPETRARSVAHCNGAIDLCVRLGIDQYSVHAGFAVNPRPQDLGRQQDHLEPLDFDESRRLFIDGVREVADYARQNGVELLLENNVVAGFNCPSGINKRYHLADMDESAHLLALFDHPAVGMMLDVGHLNVSAVTLGFDPVAFVKRFQAHVRAVQISDNDGTADQNHPVKADSWFWEHVPWDQAAYVSLEVSGQDMESLKAQIDLTHRKIAEASHALASAH